jgi:hypothetical protein
MMHMNLFDLRTFFHISTSYINGGPGENRTLTSALQVPYASIITTGPKIGETNQNRTGVIRVAAGCINHSAIVSLDVEHEMYL